MDAGFRLKLLCNYVAVKHDFSFRLLDLFKGLIKLPCQIMGSHYITSLSETDKYLVVHISDLQRPLYWPKGLPLQHLHMIIAESFYKNDWHRYEVPETQVSSGDVVLDCGAAEGLFSLQAMGRADSVIAFEPSPEFVCSLHMTFKDVQNVKIIPKALGRTPGKAILNFGSVESKVSQEQNSGIAIDMTTIDNWVSENNTRVDFIKGDLEGYEMEVLRGATETIKEFKPKIALTTYHPGNDWKEVLAFCRSLVPQYRYRVKGISFLEPGYARPVMIHLW
jgi:FkbM family methyltransferase